MNRIGWAVAGFAGVAAIGLGAGVPVASAAVTSVAVRGDEQGDLNDWNVQVFTDDCAPVWFLDNGTLMSEQPVQPRTSPFDSCGAGQHNLAALAWNPTTTGVHHIVAEQRDATGQVLSSKSSDFTVAKLPCTSSGTSSCRPSTGSF